MAVRMQACMLFAALALCLLVPASEANKLELQVLFHKVPVYKETDELCDRVVTECPTKGGDWVINAVQKLPSFTLPGSYELEVTATDEAGAELVCLVMAFDIQQPFLSVS